MYGLWFNNKNKINVDDKGNYSIFGEVTLTMQTTIDCKGKNKDKEKLDSDQTKDLLFEFCNEFKKCASSTEIYKTINIGMWLNTQKNNILNNTSKMYKILSENEVVVPEIDTLPPIKVSFPIEIPPPKVIEPPSVKLVAFDVSNIFIGLNW